MSDLARIVSGFLLWLALFSAIYGLHGLGCMQSWSATALAGTSLFRVALVTAAAVAVLMQIGVLWALQTAPLRSASPFVQSVSTWLALAAVVAQAWALFPVIVLSACL